MDNPADDRKWNPEDDGPLPGSGSHTFADDRHFPVESFSFSFGEFGVESPNSIYWTCPKGDFRVPGTVDGPFGDGVCAAHPDEILIIDA